MFLSMFVIPTSSSNDVIFHTLQGAVIDKKGMSTDTCADKLSFNFENSSQND